MGHMAMKVYKYLPDFDFPEFLSTKVRSDLFRFDALEKGNRVDDWEAIHMEFADEHGVRLGNDMPDFVPYGSVPVFQEHVYEAMRDIWDAHGQILPLRCEGQTLWAFNVLTTLEALDEQRSEVVYFIGGNKIMDVESYAFDQRVIGDTAIFLDPRLGLPIFVTDRFMNRIEEHGFTGIAPKLIWASR